MNKERLLAVKERILNDPQHFDMSCWVYSDGRFKDDNVGSVRELLNDDSRFECGTTACIAGYAVAEYVANGGNGFIESIENRAAKFLELTSREVTRLFHSVYWPEKYRRQLERAVGPVAAKVAADRIDYFIATEGRDDCN